VKVPKGLKAPKVFQKGQKKGPGRVYREGNKKGPKSFKKGQKT
jgi:hypothetical protein